MAQITNVKLLDDLDGGKAAETVAFGVDGVGYEIDLSAKNAKALRKALAEYVSVGRQVKVRAADAPRTSVRGKASGPDAATVRQWAHENEVPVSVRGRVSAEVRTRYLEANSE